MEVNKPWVTEALKAEIHKKYQLYETAKEKKTDSDWQAYKDQRTLVGKMTNTAKLEYIGSHPEADVDQIMFGITPKEAEFFCESCDRGWKTQEKLDEHLAQHEVCGRDGCTFTAHPKLVVKHVQIQHDTGLYKRITCAADVAKWIADRKSHYPTKENVEKKEAQNIEMLERGERILKHNKPFQDRPKINNWRERRQQRIENFNKSEVKRPKRPTPKSTKVEWRDPDSWRGNLPQFPGTAAFRLEEKETRESKVEEHISDEEEWKTTTKLDTKPTNKPIMSSILASLMTNYGSDMTEDEDEHDESPDKEKIHSNADSTVASIEITEQKASTNYSDIKLETNVISSIGTIKNAETGSESGPEECVIDREDKCNIPIFINEKPSLSKSECTPKPVESSQSTNPKAPPARTPLKRHQLSLLEKLLKNEIIHERNVILQCVHFVVQRNFLGCGTSAITAEI